MPKERLDTAGAIERIFALYRAHAVVLLPAALLVSVVPAVLGRSSSVTAGALGLAANVILSITYQGITTQVVRESQDGRADVTLGRLVRSIMPILGPLLWTGILVAAGFLLGFFALIVPGLVVLTYWSVAMPSVVVERATPVQALARSQELVRGRGWQVFGVLIVVLFIVLVLATVFVAIAGAIKAEAAFVVAGLLVGVITSPLIALTPPVLYFALLRLRGESPPPVRPR